MRGSGKMINLMDMEFTLILMVQAIAVIGMKTFNMVKELKNG